jgi:hypothetical protein
MTVVIEFPFFFGERAKSVFFASLDAFFGYSPSCAHGSLTQATGFFHVAGSVSNLGPKAAKVARHGPSIGRRYDPRRCRAFVIGSTCGCR